MNAPRQSTLVAPLALAAAACAALLAAVPDTAEAQCPPVTALSNNVSVSVTTDPRIFSVTTADVRWSAVGVRRNDLRNWDIEARNTTAAFPTCFTGALGTSTETSGIDFLVTDWRFRAPQIDYVGVGTAALNGTSARAEFEQATWQYKINDVYDHVLFGSDDVLTVREISLGNLNRYAIVIKPSAGTTGLKLYVFAPVTSGSGFVPRGARLLEQTLVDGTLNHIDLPPSLSPGFYALVVTNENGVAGDFWMTVKSCPYGAGPAFADNVPQATVASEDYYAFTPPAHTWNAVGIRGDGWLYNWDVAPGWRLSSWFDWTCSDSVLAQQTDGGAPSVYVIAGDFRSNPLRLYTAHASEREQPQSVSLGWMEWEDGQDLLVVDAPATSVTPPDHNVLDVWSVSLVGGVNYAFTLTPNPGTTAWYRILIFANPSPGSPYWATRPEVAAFIPGSGPYVPPVTGLYGVVVVNDDGGTGGYTIRVTGPTVGVDPPAPGGLPGATRIRALAPSPTFAGSRVDFALARAGRVGLRTTDVAGRVVVEDDLGLREAGEGSFAWAGRAASGVRPPAGVYFVTLLLDGIPQDRAKLVLLR